MQEGDCVFTIHSFILLLFTKVLLTLILTAALACLFLLLRRRAFSCTIWQNSVFGNFSIPHSLSLIAPLSPPLFLSLPFSLAVPFPLGPDRLMYDVSTSAESQGAMMLPNLSQNLSLSLSSWRLAILSFPFFYFPPILFPANPRIPHPRPRRSASAADKLLVASQPCCKGRGPPNIRTVNFF